MFAPFVIPGTIVNVALVLGLNATGIKSNPRYVKIARTGGAFTERE